MEVTKNQENGKESLQNATVAAEPKSSAPLDPEAINLRKASSEAIDHLMQQVAAVRAEVERFTGSRSLPGYVQLEERLTRLLLKLDAIDSFGDSEVRNRRKEGVAAVHSALDLLVAKGMASSLVRVVLEQKKKP